MIETLAREHADEIIDRGVDVYRVGGCLDVAAAIEGFHAELVAAGVKSSDIVAWRRALGEALFERFALVAEASRERFAFVSRPFDDARVQSSERWRL